MEKTATKTAQKTRTERRPISAALLRKLGFFGLEIAFFGTIIGVAHYRQVTPEPWFLALLAFAAFRTARTITFNEIGESLRAPFTEVKPDSCGAGANVHAKGTGLLSVIGGLIACPICTGTWAALILFSLFVFYEPVGRTLVYVLAIAGAAEVLHWGSEALEWTGRKNRVIAGSISPDEE